MLGDLVVYVGLEAHGKDMQRYLPFAFYLQEYIWECVFRVYHHMSHPYILELLQM